MTTCGRRFHDERGLIGKIAVAWLLVMALLAVAVIDAGSVLITRLKVASAAEDASLEAAEVYRDTRDRNAAYRAALEVVAEQDPDAKISGGGFAVDATTGEVTVTVVKRAWSLLAGRLGFLKHLTKATATHTSGPPTL